MKPYDKMFSSYTDGLGKKHERIYTSHEALGGIWLVSESTFLEKAGHRLYTMRPPQQYTTVLRLAMIMN